MDIATLTRREPLRRMTLRSHHGVAEDILARIGDVTVSFANLEVTLHFLIYDLLGAGQRVGRAVCSQVPFKTLRSLAVSICLERVGEGPEAKIIGELMARATKAEEERNTVAHSWWGANGPGNVQRMKSSANQKDGLKLAIATMTEADLRDIADRSKILTHDLFEFMLSLRVDRVAPSNTLEESPGSAGE